MINQYYLSIVTLITYLLGAYSNTIKILNNELYIDEFVPDNILVKGIIVFEEHVKPFSGVTVYIRLEDVSFQDAPSKLIAEQVIRNVSYDNIDQQKIEFVVYSDGIVDIHATYSISVHVDVDDDGRISEGDFITMQSYPVLTHGYPDNLLVTVKEVK